MNKLVQCGRRSEAALSVELVSDDALHVAISYKHMLKKTTTTFFNVEKLELRKAELLADDIVDASRKIAYKGKIGLWVDQNLSGTR